MRVHAVGSIQVVGVFESSTSHYVSIIRRVVLRMPSLTYECALVFQCYSFRIHSKICLDG